MADAAVEIPKRALFKAVEVCEIASVQPYVLRSWESEFPDLGVVRAAGGPRMYRRADLERVLRIKQLVFEEGLTLSGARRRMGEEPVPIVDDAVPIEELLGLNARERLAEVRRGLRSILELLSLDGHLANAPARQTAAPGAVKVRNPRVPREHKAAARGPRKKATTVRSAGRR